MKRILLTIAYDGTNYSGWQKQKDEAVITVEGELTKALRLLFRNPALECVGASRTDAGVHALGQRAVIDVETSIPAEKIPLAIRSFLPADIVVTKAEEVAETFHPRFDCVKKTYEYRFWNAPAKNPKERLYSAYVQKPLDVERMNEGAKAFLGTHDFAAFCAAGAQVSTTVRTIFDCHVEAGRECADSGDGGRLPLQYGADSGRDAACGRHGKAGAKGGCRNHRREGPPRRRADRGAAGLNPSGDFL